MADFVLFLRVVWVLVKCLSGVIVSLLVLLAGCAVVIALMEGLRLHTAVYFVLVTALTIGYGDVVPVTLVGRAASVAAGIIGILTTGLIIAIAVSAVQRAFRERVKVVDAAFGAKFGR